LPKSRRGQDDAPLRLHLLDMGQQQYGDCFLCQVGGRSILIDGGHPADWRGRDDFPSIPEQLAKILGHAKPFRVDLLVVTHCHSDHVGCLPTLVDQGIVEADWALVADEKMGFGRAVDYVPPDAPSAADRMAALLREEDYSHLADDELTGILSDAESLESKYLSMLEKLESDKTRVVRYGRDSHKALEEAFSDFGLKVLGPSQDQLLKCAEAISRFNDRSSDFLTGISDADRPGRLVDLYREIMKGTDAEGVEDRPGKGAALNDQSIVLKLEVNGSRVLFAGDMQFAVPETTGLDTLMQGLRQVVKKAGPYSFIKLSHHASYNGFDESVLEDWAETRSYAHSGGSNDANHPDSQTLELLQKNTDRLSWARTDRNGLITVDFTGGQASFTISRGELNDPTPNGDAAKPEVEEGQAATSAPAIVTKTVKRNVGEPVEVTAAVKTEAEVTRVTVTFDFAREEPPAQPRDQPPETRHAPEPASLPLSSPPKLAAGRRLPKLLFVTQRAGLENNLGQLEARAAIQMIRDAGQNVLEVQNGGSPFTEVRKALRADVEGVVILGGYDVLPARRVDALPASLRAQLGNATTDADNFIVWSDEIYGDMDGDSLPEVPVSRVPDAKSPRLVLGALTAGNPQNPQTRFPLRNSVRPFAAGPCALIPGNTPILVSAPTSPATIGVGNAQGADVYFMLHGSDFDAGRFWGENGGSMVEAVNISNIPQRFAGVVFTGCCWGALTVQTTAANYVAGQPLGVRTPGTSIALSYLHAGAKAFVGCTGTHYSPTVAPYHYFGGPMHEAFWKTYVAGAPPAKALFLAKVDYAQAIPHGQSSPTGLAIEYKIWKQYTCLGLGW
jgi:beta-lactamase superfamily II metal-dependent hydrolase